MSEQLKVWEELSPSAGQALIFAYEANRYFDGWKEAEADGANHDRTVLRKASFGEALRKADIFFERAGITGPEAVPGQSEAPEVAAN